MRVQSPRFWVCRSSAGSGKTYSLVKQYLRLCLREEASDRYTHILAITFTNNAASEMKKRILDRLHDFSQGTKLPDTSGAKQLFLEIAGDLGLDPFVLEERAQKTLTHILHHYHRFSVSTIDAFIHRIVRSFARDLWMHPDFDIEMDADRVLEEVVDRCLDQTGKNDALTQYLKRLVQFQMEEGKTWNPKSVMMDFAKTMYNEKGMEALQRQQNLKLEDFSKVFVELVKWREELATTPKALAQRAVDLLESCSMDMKEHHYYGGQQYNKLKLLSQFVVIGDKDNPFMADKLSSRWTGAMESNWHRIKGKDPVKGVFESNADEISKNVIELIDWYRSEEVKKYYLVDKWIANFYALGLVHYLYDVAEELKLERNFLMIQDFHQVISKVIIDNPAPFIYEKVGERYDDLLFDEFQDTSQLQWRNFLPLVHQSLSKGGEVFIVGDGKQSIYRWRNGDVKQFVQLPEVPMNDGLIGLKDLLANSYQPMHLATNFRSFKNVVLFNNAIFEKLRTKMTPVMAAVYEGQEQAIQSKHDGMVQWNLFQDDELAREQLIQELVAQVRECQQAGFALSDIAILTRKGKKDAGPIAQALKDAGIAINTQDSFLLAQSPKVRLIMAYLAYLAKPKELFYRFDLVRSIGEVFPNEFDRHQAILSSIVVVKRKEHERHELGDILVAVQKWNDKLPMTWTPGSSAYDMARLAVASLQMEVDEYIEFLLDQLSQKSQVWGYYPTEVVRWWEKAKQKLCINSNVSNDALQIMTVHRSKGLEFPVVIYPRFQSKKPGQQIWVPVNEKNIPIKDALLKYSGDAPKYYHPDAFFEEYEESVLDTLNLMYVAQTRAVQRLYILQEDVQGASESTGGEGWSDEAVAKNISDWMRGNAQEIHETAWLWGKKENAILEKRDLPMVQIETLNESEDFRELKIRYSATKRHLPYVNRASLRKGEMYHAFLQSLLLFQDEKSQWAYTAQKGFDLSKEEKDELIQLKNEVMKSTDFQQWLQLQGSWYIEQPMLIGKADEIRPDAYCVQQDGIVLIDFKTGKRKNEDQLQVNQYLRVLTDIWKLPVKGFLYYTKEHACIELS